MSRVKLGLLVLCTLGFVVAPLSAANPLRLTEGNPNLKRVGVMTFGPRGVLFVGDTKSAAVVAIGTEDEGEAQSFDVADLSKKIAEAVGSSSFEVQDMVAHPTGSAAYISVMVEDERPAIVRIDSSGAATSIDLSNVWFSKAELKDAPADEVTGEGRRRRNLRDECITDLAFVEGQIVVSGLSNRESASGVRSIPFPFGDEQAASSLEIFHAAHGRDEDYAAIRTFVPFMIDGEPNLLAGFVCTPLVRFPMKDVTQESKIRGTTVAELGNRNRPLDMFVYEKEGKTYLLLSNSARGIMKIGTDEIESQSLTERVGGGGTAGQSYETVEAWKDVAQMDRLSDTHALVLFAPEGESMSLKSVELP